MASRKWPYRGESPGLKDFESSRTVQSELESTKISNILHNFNVTGVLPITGRVAMPADVFLGGEDFNSLQNKLFEANQLVEPKTENEDGNKHGDAHPADGESGVEGNLEGAEPGGKTVDDTAQG